MIERAYQKLEVVNAIVHGAKLLNHNPRPEETLKLGRLQRGVVWGQVFVYVAGAQRPRSSGWKIKGRKLRGGF